MRRVSYTCLTGLLLLGPSILRGQIDLRPMPRDELWHRGVQASRAATDSPCAPNDWAYVETLVYLYAWYQTSRPTDPNEARKFASDFAKKRDWAGRCLSISRNSSSNLRDEAPTRRVAPPPPDTASFFASPPKTDVPPQTDDQGRTIPQLLELGRQLEATIRERDAQLRQRDERLSALQRNNGELGRLLSQHVAMRAAGAEEYGYRCVIEAKSTGNTLALSPELRAHVRPKGQAPAEFGIIPQQDRSRGIMDVQSQAFLVPSENSAYVTADRAAPTEEIKFGFASMGGGAFRIGHVKTNRWLRESADGRLVLTDSYDPNDVLGVFLLRC